MGVLEPESWRIGTSVSFIGYECGRDHAGMRRPSRRAKASAIAMLVLVASAALIFTRTTYADTSRQESAAMPKFRCYCDCERDGKICKMRFCELQKYEKHAWAASCRKNAMNEMHVNEPEAQPAPAHDTKHSDAVYTAQR